MCEAAVNMRFVCDDYKSTKRWVDTVKGSSLDLGVTFSETLNERYKNLAGADIK